MIPILYLDESVAVCLKPVGISSQLDSKSSENMVEMLKKQLSGDIFPIHRLDQGVGGVMVYARTQQAAAALSRAIQNGKFDKQYLCIVRGRPAEAEGIYRDLLLHDKSRNKSFVVQRVRGGVKEASLEYRVLAADDVCSLIRVRLHTGRTHQIRVQFASRKTPLLGDGKYGGGNGNIALWSFRIAFPHPRSGKLLSFRHLPEGAVWERFPPAELTADTEN